MQLLTGIAIIVLTGVFRGVRTIFLMKGGPVLRFDFFYTVVPGLRVGVDGGYVHLAFPAGYDDRYPHFVYHI